ncbi:MAG: polysaccharide biosynthesis/export family protein [Bacteroidales bacterium]|jgi:polysaccharide export outer membrane protein|nr:polysaccharide biosynthesis/export family protein [Bacteroidales bacterium]
MKIKSLIMMTAAALMLCSCSTPKGITYLQGVDSLPDEVLKSAAAHNEPVVQPGDMLQINVSSSNPEVVKPFNKTEYIATSTGANNISNGDNSIYFYLVDNNGYIDFPLLGHIKIGGMTQAAAQNYIAHLIYPKYITECPNVEIRFQNFHVYTMGEVNNPGMVKASNGRINVLEAIAQSGDLTITGRRDNVMIIHTNADGSREVSRVNLNDKNTIVSPNFNLRQNDIVYVEPNASKQRSSFSIPPQWQFGTSILGIVVSVVTLVVTLTK